ncbi:MAG: hypothetical protein EOM20_08095 [Spartobacteria bacterium]|nr:hypothetical protein [Spartobacteria bacterium]
MKCRWYSYVGLVLLLFPMYAPAASNAVIVAYFVQWGTYERDYQVTDIPAHLVTHINYAFANPVYYADSNTAALISYDPYADFEKQFPGDTWDQPLRGNFNQLIKLKKQFPHLRTILCGRAFGVRAPHWSIKREHPLTRSSARTRPSR